MEVFARAHFVTPILNPRTIDPMVRDGDRNGAASSASVIPEKSAGYLLNASGIPRSNGRGSSPQHGNVGGGMMGSVIRMGGDAFGDAAAGDAAAGDAAAGGCVWCGGG